MDSGLKGDKLESIKREIYILKDSLKSTIELMENSQIPIQFTVCDYTVPATAAAVAYSLSENGRSHFPKSALCNVNGNVITLTPEKNFFGKGNNQLMIRIVNNEKSVFSFKERVRCVTTMRLSDGAEVPSNSSLLEQILTKVGKVDGDLKTHAQEEAQAREQAIQKETQAREQAIQKETQTREQDIKKAKENHDNLILKSIDAVMKNSDSKAVVSALVVRDYINQNKVEVIEGTTDELGTYYIEKYASGKMVQNFVKNFIIKKSEAWEEHSLTFGNFPIAFIEPPRVLGTENIGVYGAPNSAVVSGIETITRIGFNSVRIMRTSTSGENIQVALSVSFMGKWK